MTPSREGDAQPSAQQFRHVLRESKNVVAVVGAGLSVASGIPTWRGRGDWTHKDPALSLSSPATFASEPRLVWQHYQELRERVLKAEPNAAHFALALLCVPSYLATVAPSARFTLVTQNIDGLDKRALETMLTNIREQPESRSIDLSECSNIYEMHERVLDTLCTSCGHLQHTSSLSAPTTQHSDLLLAGDKEKADDLPHCDLCGGLLRPGVVWFEELPRHSREIWEVIDAADLCLLIGTSSKVQPAAAFAYEVADHGGKVAVFNIQTEEGDDERDFLFLGPCERTLPNVLFDIGSE